MTVSLYDATDGDLEISAEGVDGTRVGWLEYQFVMPAHDVDVKVEFIGKVNGTAISPTEIIKKIEEGDE